MQNIARDLQNRIPRPSAPSYAPSALFSIVASAPHLAVIQQEHTKYARLFTKVHTHLADLLAALDGKATITPELDEVAYALHGNRVPSDWLYARTSRSQVYSSDPLRNEAKLTLNFQSHPILRTQDLLCALG